MGWDNIPIRAEKSLYDLGRFCQEHEVLKAYVLRSPSSELVERMAGDQVPEGIETSSWQEFRQRFDRHLLSSGITADSTPPPGATIEPMLASSRCTCAAVSDPYERQKPVRRKYTHQS
jgi:hypothetical protein